MRKKLQGYVGFANLPNQVHRKSVKKGFQFTCMVVGKVTWRIHIKKEKKQKGGLIKRKSRQQKKGERERGVKREIERDREGNKKKKKKKRALTFNR